MIYNDDVIRRLEKLKLAGKSYDLIFADPPYHLSGNGTTCASGRRVSVNKGDWDKPVGVHADFEFTRAWLSLCRDILSPTGSMWVSGTSHIIYVVGFAMQVLGFRILNDIAWFKPNASPNLACRFFTHSHETLLWARPRATSRHKFNYRFLKSLNDDRQMRSVWQISTPSKMEKVAGGHPTQKPLALLELIILSCTTLGDRVLDPFLGSGTTVVAAARLGREVDGVEIDPDFVRLTKRRLHMELAGQRESAFYHRLRRYIKAEADSGETGILPDKLKAGSLQELGLFSS